MTKAYAMTFVLAGPQFPIYELVKLYHNILSDHEKVKVAVFFFPFRIFNYFLKIMFIIKL